MPSSLQYPLERHREVQRRWERLLHQTAEPKRRIRLTSKYFRPFLRHRPAAAKPLSSDKSFRIDANTQVIV